MGRKIDVVQKFTRIQNIGQNWWWANWIRVEEILRIHHIATQPQSSRVTVKIERNTREFYRTDHLHVDVQWHLMVIKRQQERMRVKCSTRLSIRKKDSEQDNGHSSDLDQKRKWYSTSEHSSQGEWDRIAEQMMLTFAESKHPVFRSTSSLSREVLQKQRWWKIVNTLLRWPGIDWNCFSHNYFC